MLRPADANELAVVKLKQDLKYRGYVYFEQVCPYVIYQALDYLKTQNNFYEYILISEGLSSKEIIFSVNIKMLQKSIHKKKIF